MYEKEYKIHSTSCEERLELVRAHKADDQWWESKYKHSDFMVDLLEDLGRQHSFLNLCSGKSLLGNVRIDHDKSLKEPTAYADMFDALLTFKKNNQHFDCIYIDPPYERDGVNFYNPRSAYIVKRAKELGYTDHFGQLAFDWQKWAWSLCDVCLITERDRSNVNLDALYTQYYKVWDSRPSTVDVRIDWKTQRRF